MVNEKPQREGAVEGIFYFGITWLGFKTTTNPSPV